MKITRQYSAQTERDSIINQFSNLILIEEQNITEGNFSIFSDVPLEKEIIYQNVPEEKLKGLNDNQIILMDVLATMYEDMLMKGTV